MRWLIENKWEMIEKNIIEKHRQTILDFDFVFIEFSLAEAYCFTYCIAFSSFHCLFLAFAIELEWEF